jgi:hypothetical protein
MDIWIFTWKNVNFDHNFSSYTKINLSWIALNVLGKTVKLFEDNIEYFCDIWGRGLQIRHIKHSS